MYCSTAAASWPSGSAPWPCPPPCSTTPKGGWSAATWANCPVPACAMRCNPSNGPPRPPPPHKETDMRLNALLPLSLALLATPALQAEELPKAVQQIQAKGAVIKGSFDAPNGLRGYAAEYQNNGIALYLTPDGKHVL